MLPLELESEAVQLLERLVVIGFRLRLGEPPLDWTAVGLGEMLEHVALLRADAALDGDLVAEHLPDRLAQRFDVANAVANRLAVRSWGPGLSGER
jgi:hypothetical protein